MKVLITDDEAPARMRLRSLLEELDGYEVIAEATNGMEALRRCEEDVPDIVLMDIRMPGMTGLEATRHLSQLEKMPAVIFITAYDEHALDAFEANAVDYLLKPVRRERLEKALEKVQKLNRAQLAGLKLDDEENARTQLCVRSRGKLELVPVSEIIYFMADQKYVTVAHEQGEVLIEESLKSLESEFSQQFVRIHRNALVARNRLVAIEKTREGHLAAILQGTDNKLEISRRHAPGIRKLLKNLG
jgi:two-component system response regulator AlgR